MAQQDKTDWYWNGVLEGAVNNLYYDFINVDVCHTPYTTTHRNSSFFLKTRPSYLISENWYSGTDTNGWEATDVKIIWDSKCDKETGTAYAIGKKGKKKAIFAAPISNGCVGNFFNCSENCNVSSDFRDLCPDMDNVEGCGDWKLFSTDYVKGNRRDGNSLIEATGSEQLVEPGVFTGIQINRYTAGTTIGLFSDEYIETGNAEFKGPITTPGNYLLVYASSNDEDAGFAGQVRMITGVDGNRITVDSPWLGFKTPDTSSFKKGEKKDLMGWRVSYAVFQDWGEVIGFTDSNKIYLLPDSNDCKAIRPYAQDSVLTNTNIIGVADANDKIFVLTDNGYIHYSNEGYGYNKFFINDDMFAGVDKTSIVAYRDMILAFGRRHISIGVPDEQNVYRTMYNQSTTIGTWSRYSYAEYDGDLIFVSNDKRLLALTISSTGRYGLSFDDVGDRLNGKLSGLIDTDEVFIGNDDNNLRVFVQTKGTPYVKGPYRLEADINRSGDNTMTHIHKFDTLFKVWTEDHVSFLISGANEGVYYGEGGIYNRRDSDNRFIQEQCDVPRLHSYLPFTSKISAYLIENETNWLGGTNSRLASRPKLYNIAKLNRLITTLGPGKYSDNTKIRITSYIKGLGIVYEFPIGTGDDSVINKWIDYITRSYLGRDVQIDDGEDLCLDGIIKDSQKSYQPKCTDSEVYYQSSAQKTPWCGDYGELLIQDHGVCINDKLYQFAPTMPLVTNLGENQDYATQIKIELISEGGDIVCFGGRLAEMFIAPLFAEGPDGEYQLQPNTDCD